MLSLFKILFGFWILEIKISQRSLKSTNSSVRGNNHFAYCFKCSNSNRRFNCNGSRELVDSHRNRCNRLSSAVYSVDPVEYGNVNNQYLANLNWKLNNLNNSIVNDDSYNCYRDLNVIFDMISEPVSSLYSEPVELDYNSKLEELNSKFGLNLDRIDPLFILKLSTYRKSSRPDLSFEYLTQQKTDNGEIENKLWKRELKEDVPKGLKKQLARALNEFSKTIGNFFFRFYKDEIPMDDLLHRASTLGLQATGELFDGLSILQLKNDSGSESLKRSLDLIDHYSNLDEARTRCYNKLIDHFFRNNDPDSIMEVFKHLVNFPNKKISSLYLVQYLISLANHYEQKLSELDDESIGSENQFFNRNNEYITDIFQRNLDGKHQSSGSVGEGEESYTSKKKKLLMELREKLKEGLELYKEHHLSPFSITLELADILEEKFSGIVPGLFRMTLVSGNQGVSGRCESCVSKIKFDDLSDDQKFELLSRMLETISTSCPNELIGLFNFYEFLRRAKMSGNQYTCIIDGQNVGYSRNNTRYLNWFKMKYSFDFMKSVGENPLIVVPERGIRILLKMLNLKDQNGVKNINQMIKNGNFYLTNKYSYDDNFFLLAGMATFSDRELDLFHRHLNYHNIQTPETEQFDNSGYYNYNVNQFEDPNTNTNFNLDNNISNVENNNSNNVENSSSDSSNHYDVDNNIRNDSDSSLNSNFNKNSPKEKEVNPAQKTKNVIILTNDRLGNLRIENVDKDLLDKWMSYSLINFNCYLYNDREIFVVGQRLKYTFDIVSERDRFHIPLGFDRVFTNTTEIHKCSFQIKNADNTTKVFVNLYPKGETPTKKWITLNSKYLYPPSDPRHNQASDSIDETNKNKNNKEDKTQIRESDVYHRSPEIVKMMFSPYLKTSWLCVDLNAFNRMISKL